MNACHGEFPDTIFFDYSDAGACNCGTECGEVDPLPGTDTYAYNGGACLVLPTPASSIFTSTPSSSPSYFPSAAPSAIPTRTPSASPSASPSAMPTPTPSTSPSASPSAMPTPAPSASPSASPFFSTTNEPTAYPMISTYTPTAAALGSSESTPVPHPAPTPQSSIVTAPPSADIASLDDITDRNQAALIHLERRRQQRALNAAVGAFAFVTVVSVAVFIIFRRRPTAYQITPL